MSTFLQKTFLFFLPILTLIVVVEFFAGKEQNLYQRKKQVLNSQSFSKNVLGSSHAFYGIRTDGVDSYNFGWSSQTLDEGAFLISKFSETNEKTFFLTISPFTFRSTNHNRIESHRNVLFNRTFDASMVRKLEDLSFIATFGGHAAIRMARNGVNQIGPSNCNPVTGFGRRSGVSSKPMNKSAQEAAERHTKKSIDNRLPAVLENIAKKNIKLYLITTPFHESYHERVMNDHVWIFTKQFCSQLAHSNPNVHYLDYSDFPLPDSCFWDADHLNELGASLFTDELFRHVPNLQ